MAVKSARPDLLHKSDVGGVVLDVQSGEGVRAAYSSIGRALGTDSPVVLVQRVVPDGVELAAGIVHHPVFGSLVQVGAGTSTDSGTTTPSGYSPSPTRTPGQCAAASKLRY